MADFTEEQNKKVAQLVELGLPEEQAKKSAATMVGEVAATKTTTTYVSMKIKEGADLDALKTHFKEYATNSKNSKGKLFASHTIANGEVLATEVWNSPGAMDAHIGNCFPAYREMLAHCDMTEIIAICDESEVEWYKQSLSAWGASKFIVSAAVV